jgi:ATP-dependent Lhr-like helicase
MSFKEGQWFLTSSFAVKGRNLSDQGRLEAQARLLLERHGILVKEWYRREQGFAPWFEIFQTLKRMEWQGEILRGYFIKGLSGIQYALPEAVELLKSLPEKVSSPKTVILSTIDPALPFGGNVDWDIKTFRGKSQSIVRLVGNHLIFIDEKPVIYSENYGSKLWTLQEFDSSQVAVIADSLKNWLRLPALLRPVKKIVIRKIDAIPASQSNYSGDFLSCGYELDGKNIVLWPSGV